MCKTLHICVLYEGEYRIMGKREKFLLSFFIAVVFLLIVQYSYSIWEYNMSLGDQKQFLLYETAHDGLKEVQQFFLEKYGVDINSNPEIITVDAIIYSYGTITDLLFNFLCSTITLTTVIYLILIIKIKSFKEYWKDLFKAFLIILAVFLFTEIFAIVHYNFLVVTDEIEYTIGGMMVDVFMAWGTMILGNLIVNCKKLKFKKVKE